MKFQKNHVVGAVAVVVAICVAVGLYTSYAHADSDKQEAAQTPHDPNAIELTEGQSAHVPVVAIANHAFVEHTDAVGTIDFDQDTMAQVSTPYAGRIARVLVKAGDAVARGQTLFTIESPDLVQAESTAIAAAATAIQTKNELVRAKELVDSRGLAQKDYEQAVTDQQAAEAALKAARDALRIFGKSDHDIDELIASRKVDAEMPINSPIKGVVTSRNAAPGSLVQPGSVPYPMVVADTSVKWMLANVAESEVPGLALNQPVEVHVDAYPARTFSGKVENISAALDATSHRAIVRASVRDPADQLKAQMFATFRIATSAPVTSPAAPVAGVVREGDGTHTVWVTSDKRVFTMRVVEIGMVEDGLQQIVAGVHPGETIASDGALFLSNARTLNQQ